jgi:hypothetical protein
MVVLDRQTSTKTSNKVRGMQGPVDWMSSSPLEPGSTDAKGVTQPGSASTEMIFISHGLCSLGARRKWRMLAYAVNQTSALLDRIHTCSKPINIMLHVLNLVQLGMVG